MLTFLKILLAVFVVIVGLLVFAGWFIKRKFKAAVGDYVVASELLGHSDELPARVSLRRSEICPDSEFNSLHIELNELGFQRMADLMEDHGAFYCMRAYSHRSMPIAAALTQVDDDRYAFVFFTMTSDKRVIGRGNGPGKGITNPRVDWQIDDDFEVRAAFEAVQGELSDDNPPIDLRHFRAIFEQVWAVSMDEMIAKPPTREAIEAQASTLESEFTEDQIDIVYSQARENWQHQVSVAALDRFRRTSKIDAVEWEALRDEVEVIHEYVTDDEVEDLLAIDEKSEQLFLKFKEQNLTGLDLFRAIASRLPPDQQWEQIGAVDRPVRAFIFKPAEDIASDRATAGRYVYTAIGADGKEVQGAVVATDGKDAKAQINALGLTEGKLISAPAPFDDELEVGYVFDDKGAKIVVHASKESIIVGALRAFGANWWIWLPPAGLLTKSLYDGAPFGWGDYVVFVYAGLAAAALVFLIAPMILYSQFQLAVVKAATGQAKLLLRLLELTSIFGGITKQQILAERCKVISMAGGCDDALALWEKQRNTMADDDYFQGLASIHDADGNIKAMLEAQHAYLETTSNKDLATVDVAMSLARYTEEVDAAETMLMKVAPSDLPEIALMGFHYARGLIASQRGQHGQALKHYEQAIKTAEQFAGVPLILAIIAEINGQAALTLKRTGKRDEAEVIWGQVGPLLSKHRSSARLVSAYDAA